LILSIGNPWQNVMLKFANQSGGTPRQGAGRSRLTNLNRRGGQACPPT
jgi:hypothetical protein